MHERLGRDVGPAGRRPRSPSPHHATLNLQRMAGNRAVAQLLRQPEIGDPPPPPKFGLDTPEAGAKEKPATGGRIDYVFVMGSPQGDHFYKGALAYFKKQYPAAKLVTSATTLADILKIANASKKPIANLFIVSHGNAEGTMFFGLGAGAPTMLQYHDLYADQAGKTSVLPKANTKVIDANTTIRIKGCNVGRSKPMVNLLDKAFGGKGKVVAPTHSQMFKTSGTTETIGEYYVSVPGHVRKNDDEILQMFTQKYSWIEESEWRRLLVHKREHRVTDPIPVNNLGIEPRDQAHAETWFRGRPDWAQLRAEGYDDVTPKRIKRPGTHKIRWEFTVTGPRVTTRRVNIDFDPRPSDEKLLAGARAQHGLPDASDFTIESRGPASLDLNVVARRTTWVIENQPIRVKGKDVRGGLGQADWYTESTYQ